MTQPLWLMLLALHIAGAGVWWWLVGGVVPFLVIGVLLVALFARGRLSEAMLPPLLAVIPVFWMLFGISARLVFFESFRGLWNLFFIGGACLAALWVKQFRFRTKPVWLVPVLAVAAALTGWLLPETLRAAEPATHPTGTAFADAPAGIPERKLVKLSRDAQLHPDDARVVIRRDKLVLNVQPLLSFTDRSPDRFWIALAPADVSLPTKRKLVATSHEGGRWLLQYKDEDQSLFEVVARDGTVQIDSRSRLAQPIYSHVNTFAELTVQGHQKLSLSFSPAPRSRIEIAPVGAPARLAYLDPAKTFHVVQAKEAQRGPFTEIASGPLTGPLVLTIFDGDKPVFRVSLEDWAAQASTQLSPTSELPENVIEMQRGGEAESSPVLITFSLATTAIGRGTQTVGHAAGVYRNRVSVFADK